MKTHLRFAMSLCAAAALASGCGGHNASAIPSAVGQAAHRKALSLPKYVIVMVQENRTVDNLFQTQPGVDTQNFGIDSHGHHVPLTEVHLGIPYDCSHAHAAFVREVTRGFDLEQCTPGAPSDAAFSYVNPADITQYTALASQYAIADETLQSNEGPSFPAHIYLIAATTNDLGTPFNIAENDGSKPPAPTGCNADPNKRVKTIDMSTAFPGKEDHPIFPCINPPTIFNELDGAGITWK
ncbi:MAG TPA: alkaline phosphatase family protein, partial [Candidatus Eremiobacteraceae bacterium]|nr:alkaline phosphatase family protein [Candidatus Eremiobacteraceae bacterium]